MITVPLYALIKKGASFVWDERCQAAFDELKARLVSGTILALPLNEGIYRVFQKNGTPVLFL